MRISKIGLVAFLGAFVLFGSAQVAAQGNSQWAHEKNRIRKEKKAIEKARKHGYRLYRSNSFYETDQRGVDLIRRAINTGYQQGYRSGAGDRRYSRQDDHRGDPFQDWHLRYQASRP